MRIQTTCICYSLLYIIYIYIYIYTCIYNSYETDSDLSVKKTFTKVVVLYISTRNTGI